MTTRQSKLVKQLTANRKQLWVLVALVTIGLLLWGRVLLKQVPRTAVAGPDDVSLVAAGPDTEPIESLPSIERPVIYTDVADDPGRNLFAWNTSRYARPADWRPPTVGPEKSVPQRTDDSRVPDLVAQAQASLKLQTTVLGERPKAMINGQLLHVGQQIEGFKLRQVGERKVVLEMIQDPNQTWPTDGPIFVELEM